MSQNFPQLHGAVRCDHRLTDVQVTKTLSLVARYFVAYCEPCDESIRDMSLAEFVADLAGSVPFWRIPPDVADTFARYGYRCEGAQPDAA